MKSKKIAKSLFSMAALFCFWLSLMVIIFPAGQNPEALPAAANAAIDVKETIAKEEIVYPQSRKLVPLGLTTGIKMFSGGAMIVNFSALSQNGGKSPAQEAGLEVGDVIIGFNGQKVASNADLVSCLTACSNHNIELEIMRQNQIKTVAVKGISGGSGAGYKIGAWVRDSIAGIGTITFVDPQNGAFGALGHGISDGDTGQLMLFENGSIMESSVSGVKKGQSGDPGELTGRFDLTRDQGVLYSNTNLGIFGKITDKTLYSRYTPMETASKNEIKTGKAYIFCNVQDQQRNKYEIEIVKIYNEKSDSPRDMMIKITDPDLIEITGGIVQGMSGSPIIQNGKIIGAVTHVLINDPLRGYAISIDNMLDGFAA